MSAAGAQPGLDAVLADLLGDAANAGLELDPASRARLAALEGREVRLVAELPLPLGTRELSLAVRAGRLRCFARGSERPDVVVRGTGPDLAAWLLRPGGNGPRAAGSRLQIDGDGTVLAELEALLRGFRPDPAPVLGRLLGDELADAALGTAELAFAALRSALAGAGQALRHGAADIFVDRERAAGFLDELDDLRLRVDRLQARVEARERARQRPHPEEPAGPAS